jgi:hypothetical protein
MPTPTITLPQAFAAPRTHRGLSASVRLAVAIGLAFLFSFGSARAHEPYLLLKHNGDGTFTAETGFSDGSDVAGLKLLVRSRGSGETLGEHTLPAGGKLTLPIPSTPYRVTFDGGPGHKISKPGPDAPVAPAAKAAAAPPAEETGTRMAASDASGGSSRSSPDARALGERRDVWLIVSLVFALAVVSFALGYAAGAGRRKSP